MKARRFIERTATTIEAGDQRRGGGGAQRSRLVPSRPRRRFGQHFLNRADVARRIVSLAELRNDSTALEIGPGLGALTRLLAAASGRLLVVEIDRDLTRRLREEFVDQTAVQVIEADVLDLDLRSLLQSVAPVAVVANLPYNISTPVLMQLLETPELFARLVLMLQREVAARMCAEPGTREYGALSVMVQLVAKVRIAFGVPPNAFSPRPKVDSAVVVVEPFHPAPLSEGERKAVRRVVRTAFSRRRKQLGNVLTPLTSHPHDVLRGLGIDPRRRPETLSAGDFLNLSQALQTASGATQGSGGEPPGHK